MKLSIITVNYKVKEELFRCIASIHNSGINISYEIIVVDNDEEKTIGTELKKKFPGVTYIKSPGNIGFGAGNNLGVKHAKGEYLFFLNPDTTVSKNSINKLISFLDENKQAGIVAPLLLDHQGSPYPLQGTRTLTPLRGIVALSFLNKLFPKNPISKTYWLMDWDKKSTKDVDVIPGTAFVIRSEIFKKAGQFDEHFFMYYEEHDVCNRVKKMGYDIYILPSAKITHAWGSSSKKSKRNINKIFLQSQFYYFKKQYGIFWAIIVKLITGFGKEQLLFLLLLALGFFLRTYRIEPNMSFDAEVGDNLLDIKNAFINTYLPLKGPPTSHPWLSFGPLFYWLYGPILILANFNPLSHAYFGVFIAMLIIIANFYFVKKLFSKQVAFISSFLIVISPMYLFTARIARFTFIVSLLIYPFLWMVKKIMDGEKKYFVWLCLLFGVMLNFHYTPLFLIPVFIAICILKKITFSRKEIIYGAGGFLLPLLPLVLYDFQNKTNMFRSLFLWIPYRVLGFLGLYPKNTVSEQTLQENTLSLINFFSYSFTPTPYNSYTVIGILIFLFVFLFLGGKIFYFVKTKTLPNIWLILFLWGGFGFLALFIHGSAPLHYFVPLFPLPILLFSILLVDIWKKHLGKILILLFLGLLSVINFQYFFSDKWFYAHTHAVHSYQITQQVVHFILHDAQGQKFSLQRIGYNDIFEKQFAQNYIYLLWWQGNEPIKKAKRHYVIYDGKANFPNKFSSQERFFLVSDTIGILRKDL